MVGSRETCVGVHCGIKPHEAGCGLDQSGGGEEDEGSGCIWKVDLIEFVDKLDAGCERKQQVKDDAKFLAQQVEV